MHLAVFLLFNCVIYCYSFNLDTNYPIVYEDPSKYLSANVNNSNYFGYSVVLYPGNRQNKPWILIGAPKGYNVNKIRSGTCFKCAIAEACDAFNINGHFQSSRADIEEKIDTAWIGASMDISYKSERIVACAPRWTKVRKGKNNKVSEYLMQGACYWFHIDDNSTQSVFPLFEPNRDVHTHSTGGSVYYYGQGQAGFSVHMPQQEKEMVLGAPGVYNWDGTAILYKDSNEAPPEASRLQNSSSRRARYAEPGEFSFKNIANAISTKQTVAYDLLGYSTTSGYFYSTSKLLYVTSAPRSYYKGQVLIYDFYKIPDQQLSVKESKNGQQFGEYFGAAVAAGDINQDGLDDLIVGAPFHTTQKYNEGKIYIFLGSTSGRLQEPKRNFIVGKAANGQFGSSVQYLGDINGDRFGDVAIAAPYEEENSGVVYLFRGTSDGLDTTHSQRIVGRSVHQNIRGFGMSISRAVDIDTNGYSDLAIGAYLSGHVVLLRSRPVITIFQELISLAPHLDSKTRVFEMRECFWYKWREKFPSNITINRTILIDQQLGRAFLESEEMKIVDLYPDKRTCRNFTVRLTNSFSNRYDPITATLSHTFMTQDERKQVIYVDQSTQGTDMFCPRCPVYNKYESISSSTVEIPFSLGCKSGNICRAELGIALKINDIGEDNTFVLGSKNYITLQIDIANTGEKAYLTQVLVTVPEIVTFRSTPPACTEKNVSAVMCAVDNPLDTNSQKPVILELDMTTVNSGKDDRSLTFAAEVTTSSENEGDKTKNLLVILQREADVTIMGKSEEQSYSYRNISQGKPKFTQIYQIEKFGSSLLNEILVEINVPHIIKVDDDDDDLITFINLYSPVATIAGQNVICNSNFTYIIDEKQTLGDSDSTLIEESLVIKEHTKRSIKDTQSFNKSTVRRERLTKENDFEAFQNRTYYVNCSNGNVICSKVLCTAGPIKSGQNLKITLNMLFDISAVKELLGKKDIVLFATQGRVLVTNPNDFVQSGDKPDSAEVVSLFIGESQTEKVALWIIIISAVAGILLLLLLIFGLIKAGFFKRTTKEELVQLKKELGYNTSDNLNVQEEEIE